MHVWRSSFENNCLFFTFHLGNMYRRKATLFSRFLKQKCFFASQKVGYETTEECSGQNCDLDYTHCGMKGYVFEWYVRYVECNVWLVYLAKTPHFGLRVFQEVLHQKNKPPKRMQKKQLRCRSWLNWVKLCHWQKPGIKNLVAKVGGGEKTNKNEFIWQMRLYFIVPS